MTDETEKKFTQIYDKLARLEQHVINLIIPIQQISSGTVYDNLKRVMNQPLQIDDRSIRRIISDFVSNFDTFTKILKDTNLKELAESIKETNMAELNGIMKYQANRLKGIEARLDQIEKNASEKKVRVKVFVDEEEHQGESLDLKKEIALNGLDDKEKLIFKYRTQWIEGASTFKAIGQVLGVPTERIRQRYKKVLLKLIKETKIESLKEIMPEKSFSLMCEHFWASHGRKIA